jgi:Tol biopolymer transport system component
MSYRVRGPLSIDAAIASVSPSQVILSPRGDRLAFTLDLGAAQPLFLMEAAGGWPRRITPDDGRYGRPAWAPDGRRLASVLENALWRINDDGLDRARLYEHPAGVSEPEWSPDGATIAFRSRERGWDQIWSVPFAGGAARRLTMVAADNGAPRWSPGARFLRTAPYAGTCVRRISSAWTRPRGASATSRPAAVATTSRRAGRQAAAGSPSSPSVTASCTCTCDGATARSAN